jgi:iron complex transport system substrate-binding protein
MTSKESIAMVVRGSSISKFLIVAAVLGMVIFAAGCVQKQTDGGMAVTTITDMAGRNVTIPAEVNRVLCTSPPTTMIVYMLSPDKLAGWNFKPNDQYVPSKYKDLPVVGGWFGTKTGNYENFISMHPDIVLEGFNVQGDFRSTINERQQKLSGIPVVGVDNTVNATEYEAPIRFIGDLLGEEEQAAELISFYNRVLDEVNTAASRIPESEKRGVYYAEGPKGLMTDPKGSQHSQLIELCGGVNVAQCPIKKGYGRAEVSIEQVLNWDPDVIIAGDPTFYEKIYSNPLWQNITAVKNHDVYLTPLSPFCWFDRPPSVNRIIGIPWTAKMLYPEKFGDMDLNSLTKEFYSKFYHCALSDEEVYEILHPHKEISPT